MRKSLNSKESIKYDDRKHKSKITKRSRNILLIDLEHNSSVKFFSISLVSVCAQTQFLNAQDSSCGPEKLVVAIRNLKIRKDSEWVTKYFNQN